MTGQSQVKVGKYATRYRQETKVMVSACEVGCSLCWVRIVEGLSEELGLLYRDTPALGATGSTFQHQETTDENGLP